MQAEEGDELVLVLGEAGVAAGDVDAVLAVVDGEVARGEDAGIGHGGCAVGRARVADGGADAREELLGAEGLGEVVVGAGVEGLDLIALVAAGGDDKDGDLRPFADAAEDGHAVHVGQAEVEDDEVGTVRGDHGVGHRAGAGHEDVVAVGGEDGLHEAADGALVLNQKYFLFDLHGSFPPMVV